MGNNGKIKPIVGQEICVAGVDHRGAKKEPKVVIVTKVGRIYFYANVDSPHWSNKFRLSDWRDVHDFNTVAYTSLRVYKEYEESYKRVCEISKHFEEYRSLRCALPTLDHLEAIVSILGMRDV